MSRTGILERPQAIVLVQTSMRAGDATGSRDGNPDKRARSGWREDVTKIKFLRETLNLPT